MRLTPRFRTGMMLLTGLIAVSTAGCSSSGAGLAQRAVDALPEGAATSGQLSLDQVADGAWDEYLIVCPYDTVASVEERIGFSWSGAPDLSQADDAQALVLVGGEGVVDHAELGRTAVDLCAGSPWTVQDRKTPIDLTRDANTEPWTGEPASS